MRLQPALGEGLPNYQALPRPLDCTGSSAAPVGASGWSLLEPGRRREALFWRAESAASTSQARQNDRRAAGERRAVAAAAGGGGGSSGSRRCPSPAVGPRGTWAGSSAEGESLHGVNWSLGSVCSQPAYSSWHAAAHPHAVAPLKRCRAPPAHAARRSGSRQRRRPGSRSRARGAHHGKILNANCGMRRSLVLPPCLTPVPQLPRPLVQCRGTHHF